MKRLMLAILMLLMLTGCLTTKEFVKYETTKKQSIEEAKAGVELMLQGLEFRTGLLDGVLGPYRADLPANIVSAFAELKQLVEKYKADGTLSDYDMGLALGIQLRLRGEVMQTIIKKYAPGVLKYVL